jgi:hypothetical protein
MFKSLLGSRKDGLPSETTPLLAALARYRSRNDEQSDEADEFAAQYDGADEEDDDDDEDEDERQGNRRDGPLLPVFSAEFLGTSRCSEACLLHRTDAHAQTAYPSTTRPTPSASSFFNNARRRSPGTSCAPRRSRSSWSSLSSSAYSPATSLAVPYTVYCPTVCSSVKRAR